MFGFEEVENYYEQYWVNEENFVVMPFTIRAREYLKKIVKDVKIKLILDNNINLAGMTYENVSVKHAREYLSASKKYKILVSNHYAEVSKQLDALGYREYIDYIDMHTYVSLWYWNHKKEIHVPDVHTAITSHCSLNCVNCNMFINHYQAEKKRMMSLVEFQADYDVFFEKVAYCYKVSILGGEPLLNKELPDMLKWLYNKYRDKIGVIVITTNGTILPTEELLHVLKETKTEFRISDYSLHVPYKEKVDAFEKVLIENEIPYIMNHEMQWKDFYFPTKKQGVDFVSEHDHMMSCNPVFRGLNDKKFYFCHILWSAVQAGIWQEKEQDYINLEMIQSTEDKKRLLAHDLGFIEGGSVSLCRVCGGCGVDNSCVIDAGVQEKNNIY